MEMKAAIERIEQELKALRKCIILIKKSDKKEETRKSISKIFEDLNKIDEKLRINETLVFFKQEFADLKRIVSANQRLRGAKEATLTVNELAMALYEISAKDFTKAEKRLDKIEVFEAIISKYMR